MAVRLVPRRDPIASQSALHRTWGHYLGDGHHRLLGLHLMFVAPGDRPLRKAIHLSHISSPPTVDDCSVLTWGIREIVEGAEDLVRVAFLIVRRGSRRLTPDDVRYATCLYDVAREVRLPCEVVHLATEAGIVPLGMDEVIAA